MELLLLKSSVCLLALLLFYKIALEPLSIHKFKRVYLLVAVAVAGIIPFITFVKYVQPAFDKSSFIFDTSTTIPLDTNFKIVEETNYLPIILYSIYALGVGLFFIRFCINLFKIVSKIRKHTKVKSSSFINVLMEQLEIPHTFFNYIFLNKNKFENKQIPAEVLLHEQTHAKQKHSIDIIIIELLQVMFWFNPLIYWLKKEAKLNHEFLADQAVLNHGVDTKNYQNILLKFSSNQQELVLANAINYSSIKKRFTLMNTQTPTKTKWIRSVLLLPLLALLLYSFSSTREVEKELTPAMLFQDEKEVNTRQNTLLKQIEDDLDKIGQLKINYTKQNREVGKNIIISEDIEITINDKNNIYINNKQTNIENFKSSLEDFNIDLSIENRRKLQKVDIIYIGNPEMELLTKIKNILRNHGYSKLNLVTKSQDTLLKVNGIECDGCTLNFSKKGIAELILTTTNQEDITNFKLKIPGVKTLFNEGNIPSNETRQYISRIKKGDFIMLFDIASKSKKYKSIRIQLVDIDDENYSESPKVKKGKESSIPPPPPPPPANPNATPEEKAKQVKIIEKYNKENKIVNGKVSRIPPPPPISTLEHVIKMAKKGASFYYNGKVITSDRAINLVKKNPKLNISSNTNNGVATVHISEKPIRSINGKVIEPKIDQMASTIETKTTHLTINADTLNELKAFDWKALPIIFESNNPEEIITLSFSLDHKVNFKNSEIDNFNFTISDKTSQLNTMISKSKKAINKLRSI